MGPEVIRVVRANLAEVRADAICTSTNPRLSLHEGTGGAVAERGGWEIKRACEALLDAEKDRTGVGCLRVGSVRVTTAGNLAAKIVIHCVASDEWHRSSKEIISACAANALAVACRQGCDSIAMPVFATGHAAFRFEDAAEAMAEAVRESDKGVRTIMIATLDGDRLQDVRRVFERAAGLHVDVVEKGVE